MNFYEIILAILLAGLPVALIGGAINYWALSHEFLSIDEIKNGKLDKQKVKQELRLSEKPKRKALYNKWATFGGGFYGTLAFITYIHVEIIEIYQAFAKFESFSHMLDTISFSFFIGLIMNAIANFITAFLWWSYWDDILPVSNGWLWLVIIYVAYLIGERVAQQFYQNKNKIEVS